jgi:hypothetical protein
MSAWLGMLRENDPNTVPSRVRLRVEKIGGGDTCARRHVLDNDRRLSGDVPGEVSHEETPGKVVVVAHRVSDDQSDLLVLIEVLRRLARGLAPRRSRGAECDAKAKTDRGDRRVRYHRLRLAYSAARSRTSAAAALS